MKKVLYIVYFLIISLVSITVYAQADILTFDTTKYNENNINYIYDTNEGYILIEDNIIYSYVNNNLISRKEFTNLTNAKIISFKDKYLLVGIENSTLKAYYIDKYLQIDSSINSTITNIKNIKLYSYNNKVYILDLLGGLLNSTKIYEIGDDLTIIENNFSSYSSEELKNILKSDYYLLHLDGTFTENKLSYYNNSTYIENNIILVGYVINEDNTTNGLINILDSTGNSINNIIVNEVLEFIDIEIINNNIVALTKDDNTSYLYIYNLEGSLIDKITINNTLSTSNIYRISNYIYLIDNAEQTTINIYKFNTYINKEENLFGTINVLENANPNEVVKIEVIPNSGYEVESILVKNTKGEIIDLKGTTFTMPADDVSIDVTFTSNLTNPETIDPIFIVIAVFVIFCSTTIIIFKKLKWLK